MKINTLKVIVINVILLIGFSILVIQDFRFPFFGYGNSDLFQTEQTFYDFQKHFHFDGIFPKWNIVNDLTAYPYGNSHALQSWMIEMNLFYTFCKHFFLSSFGCGQVYYLISISISLFGSFFMLKKDFGITKSFIVSLFFTFFNFYAINKYPGHFYYSIFHWAALSLCCDFIFLKRAYLSEIITARLFLLKTLFLSLTIGLDIGYILSFSFSLTACMILGILFFYLYKGKNVVKEIKILLLDFTSSFKVNSKLNIFLCVLIFFVWFIYGGLFIQLLNEVRLLGSTINGGVLPNINLLRILLPYFPSFNPITFGLLFNESSILEGVGEGSIGWFILIISIWSASKLKKEHWIIVTPYLLLVLICYAHFAPPFEKPFLKIIPWHFYTRVSGRFTVFLPAIAGFIFLISPIDIANTNKIFLRVCMVIGIVELFTFYNWRYTQTPIKPNAEFLAYMNIVKAQPGEAVLDFPICVVGGNGVGALSGLCPLYDKNSHVYAFQIYHHKKVIGKYNGRLNPKQIQPFLEAGWQNIMTVKNKDVHSAQQLSVCLDKDRFDFLKLFFQTNDFAGINLYVDLIPKECAKEFYTVFGNPIAETTAPGAGRVVFIPKKALWQKMENKELGKTVKFTCDCK